MPMPENIQRVIIIDSHALIHRSYHALPPLTTKNGQIVNAVYGFSTVLLKAIKELKPEYILAAFDLDKKTFRHEAYDGYKAQRKKGDDELYSQIPLVKRLLEAFNIPCFEKEGFEADDVIGTIVKKLSDPFLGKSGIKNKFVEIIIVTGDLDTLQLVNAVTKIYTLRKGMTDTVIYDEAMISEKYGLTPDQMNDFKGLKGDPSDNIPGVPGVGEKTASELIRKFQSMENLYHCLEKSKPSIVAQLKAKSKVSKLEIHGNIISKKVVDNLLEFKDQAFFSKELSTIRCDVPLELDLQKIKYIKDFDAQKIIALFKEFEFYSLIDRLNGLFPDEREKNVEALKPAPNSLRHPRDRYGEMNEEIEKLYRAEMFSKQIYTVEKGLVPVIKEMERIGVKINAEHLKDLSKKLNTKIKKLETEVYQMAGEEFNLNSSQQLSKILFETLNLSVKGLRKTPKGAIISTNAKELLKLQSLHPIIGLVLQYRELSKLKSTYTDSLIKMINPVTGRIHTQFNPLGTVTGRISSSNPNLQNIPIRTELGNEIRKAFVAEDGYVFISADYSQIELRIIADLANDTKMKQAFIEGKDIHSLTAAEVHKIPLEQVTSKMRSLAKAINFGIIYGMGINGFAQGAGVSRQEAKEFIEKYRDDFPQIMSYIDTLKQRAYEQGYAQTIFGRKRTLPDLQSKLFQLRRAAERMAVNMPIQGTEADIVKMAMIAVNEYISTNKQFSKEENPVRLLLQVHDELVLEVKKELQEEVAGNIKQIMEHVDKLSIPLKVEICAGDNWGEMEKIDKKNK